MSRGLELIVSNGGLGFWKGQDLFIRAIRLIFRATVHKQKIGVLYTVLALQILSWSKRQMAAAW